MLLKCQVMTWLWVKTSQLNQRCDKCGNTINPFWAAEMDHKWICESTQIWVTLTITTTKSNLGHFSTLVWTKAKRCKSSGSSWLRDTIWPAMFQRRCSVCLQLFALNKPKLNPLLSVYTCWYTAELLCMLTRAHAHAVSLMDVFLIFFFMCYLPAWHAHFWLLNPLPLH